jgi:hypothetical protein
VDKAAGVTKLVRDLTYGTTLCREFNLWQTCHEIAEKSSKIVPSGAPLSWGHFFSIASGFTLNVVSNCQDWSVTGEFVLDCLVSALEFDDGKLLSRTVIPYPTVVYSPCWWL